MSDDRPAVYWEEPWFIIRGSAIGGCMFELVAAGQQLERMDFPAVLIRAFAEGQEREQSALDKMEAEGWRLWGSQDEYEWVIREPTYGPETPKASLWSPGIKIRWHPDALGTRNPREAVTYLVEVKWLADAGWRKAVQHGPASVIPEYAWQLSTMMWDLVERLPDDTTLRAVWAIGNKGFAPDDQGVKPYCEDEGRIYYDYVDTPPISKEQIVAKAMEVVDRVLGDDIHTSGLACTSPTHWPCLYRHLLPPDESADEGPKPGQILLPPGSRESEEFRTLVAEYQRHKGTEDEAKVLAKAAKEALFDFVERVGGDLETVQYVEDERFHLPVIPGRSAGGIDWAAMPPELKKAVEKYKKPGKRYFYTRDIRRND